MFFAALCIWFCEGIPESKGWDTRQACISASITNCRLLCGHFINYVYVPAWASQNSPHNSGRYFPIPSVSNLLVWKLAQSSNLSKDIRDSVMHDLLHGILQNMETQEYIKYSNEISTALLCWIVTVKHGTLRSEQQSQNQKERNMLLEEVLEVSTNTISHGRKLNWNLFWFCDQSAWWVSRHFACSLEDSIWRRCFGALSRPCSKCHWSDPVCWCQLFCVWFIAFSLQEMQ